MSQEWKLVPAEPTPQMVNAALKISGIFPQYAAMLAAAPVPPAGRDEEPLLDEDTLRDLASSACQTALCEGINEEAFARLARTVEQRAHAHVTRLHAENAALQQRLNVADQRVDDLERKAKLYDQLQRGAELLPEGWMITVEIERDGGGVTLIDPQGNDLDYPSNRESMGDEVEDAIEEALAQQVAL